MVAPKYAGNNKGDDEGNALWRRGPSPDGQYWKEGMKLGYQDTGSWTILKSTPLERAKAAWLYAQFVVSKTVDVKKSHVGLTFIRDSTVRHESFTERSPQLGGLVEFSRSPEDRKSVVSGKSVSVRVDLGGRRIIKKKTK